MRQSGIIASVCVAALALVGCGSHVRTLPADAIDRAASCGAIAAAGEREAAGMKGDLSADAQGRILHYALLAGTADGTVDRTTVSAVSRRQPELFETTVKGKWQTLRPACAAAFPATTIARPVLPEDARTAVLQCDALTGFVRQALGSARGGYSEALTGYGVLADALSNKVAAGGKPTRAQGDAALAAAARLGPPPAVIAACTRRFK